jgi:hypothetical protein
MNERIKKLAEQAREHTEEFNSVSFKLTTEEWEEIYNEKFTELIVRECLELTFGKDRRQLLDKSDLNGANLVQKDIIRVLKHFGVEK